MGRVSAIPDFGKKVFDGTTSKCVDVFMDEGHREGARALWEAWVQFLMTKPPREFLQEWSQRLQNFSIDDAKHTGRAEKGDPFKGITVNPSPHSTNGCMERVAKELTRERRPLTMVIGNLETSSGSAAQEWLEGKLEGKLRARGLNPKISHQEGEMFDGTLFAEFKSREDRDDAVKSLRGVCLTHGNNKVWVSEPEEPFKHRLPEENIEKMRK